eukprot:m.131720 g.131720  ORF g.131720 m.131720 type:complete len:60 (+) comp17480_c0_seq2:764-943(+)
MCESVSSTGSLVICAGWSDNVWSQNSSDNLGYIVNAQVGPFSASGRVGQVLACVVIRYY